MAQQDLEDALNDAIVSPVVVVDRRGVIVRFNRACEKVSGRSRAEVLRRPLWEALALPDRIREDEAQFFQSLAGSFPHTCETTWLTQGDAGGAGRRICWSVDAVRDPEGNIQFIVYAGAQTAGIPLDATQIGKSEVWFHKVIETAHEGIGIIDPQGRMIYVNPRLCELSGYPPDELLGRKFFEFQANAAQAGERRLAERRAGKRESYEVQLRKKDGSLVWVLMNGNPILNERGEMVASLGMVFDINARRAAEAAQRESEERFRLAVESAPDVMFYQDVDLRFTWISKTTPPARPEDVIGRTDFDLIEAEQAKALVEVKKRVLQTGKTERIENRIARDDRVLYFETVIVRRQDAGGRVLGLAGYARNVTERKLAEQALRELNANLERRVDERTESLRVSEERYRKMADHNRLLVQELEHRVGNNLAGLLGLVTVMRDRTRDVDAFADAIQVRLRGMAHVHQMLTQTAWNAVDLRQLIESALQAVRDTASFPTEEQLQGPLVPVAARHVLALTLILLEFYTNSCKYGAHSVAGGQLLIRWTVEPDSAAARIRLTWQERGGPTIQEPVNLSLGTHLVRLFAKKELSGRCDLKFPPHGAEHLIEFPMG